MDPGPLGKVDAMIFLLFSQEAAAPDPSCPTLILKKKKRNMSKFKYWFYMIATALYEGATPSRSSR